MFILLFDIDRSNYCRCHQYGLTLLFICLVFINRCEFVQTIETTTLNIGSDAKSTSHIALNISPSSPQQHQPKPSSVIYIPSLDDVNTASSLHSSEHDIRFEDFFWNGSGDEPLTLSLKSNARLTAMNGFVGRETFIKTATVIATVYIDDSNENENDPNCKLANCDDDDSNEIPDIYMPPNKHFWLVTTVAGQLTDEDIPLLQDRLADVYRHAFAKQQSLHLGLSNVTIDGSQANETTPIIENKQSTNLSMPISPTSVLKYEYGLTESIATSIESNKTFVNFTQSLQRNESSKSAKTLDANRETIVESMMSANQSDSHQRKRSVSSISLSSIRSATSTTIIQPTQIILQSTVSKSLPNASNINNSKTIDVQKMHYNAKTNMDKSSKASEKHRNDAIIGRISVLIHNISVISSADKDYLDNSEKEWMNSAASSNLSSDSLTSTDNQTEIIYTVFVNGIPVLATIAANDMKLMSDAEVSKMLEKPVYTKAEPYLKEPQATPLIPSSTVTTNQNKPILATIFQNPYILAFIMTLILLIILLLMILMLVTGSKKNQQQTQKKGESKSAQTAQQSFLPAVPPKNASSRHIGAGDGSHQFRSNITNEIPYRQSNVAQHKKQVGTQITSLHDSIDGFAYERDHSFIIIPSPSKRKHNKKVGTPTIYFPEPPSSEPSTPSPSQSQSHSSTSTSDTSSIYYIKRHKSRRHHLYSKRPKRITALNHREYATITKKQIERAQQKNAKSKHKRKYMKGINGNRVGAYEETVVQVHSSRSSSMAGQNGDDDECKQLRRTATVASNDENFEMSIGKDSNLYEHIEAFNPMVGKKNVHNQFMSPKQIDNGEKMTISNEIEKHVQSKSHLIDRRQNKNDNVNQLRNGMNTVAVNTVANDMTKSMVNSKSKKGGADPATHHVAHPSDENIKMKTDRISHQLSNDEVVHDNTTNDDLSVGSFLSMASVRSFPKCNVPEPLSRVLEPVSITYLDQYDEIEATEAATLASKLPRIVDAKEKSPPKSTQYKPHETTADKKCDEIVYLSRTRSDGADPGVIGPIAWQYHKKRLEDQQRNAKFHIDPMCTQHRYEDLVEGAISLYSIETTEYHTIETITKEEFPEILIGKDMRGKSADVFPTPMSASKSSPKIYRPFTAVPSKTAPEIPITSKGAWTGSTLIQTTDADAKQTNPDDDPTAQSSLNQSTQKH